MKNFQVTAKEDNKKYWISRSVAVAVFVFYIDEYGEKFVLANKRGVGAADYQGCWNCPCGYLDFDETLIEAAKREVFEETGYKLDSELVVAGINDQITENHQNVTIRYKTVYREKLPIQEIPEGGEQDEVADVKWINVKYLKGYKWAFNHDKIIQELM